MSTYLDNLIDQEKLIRLELMRAMDKHPVFPEDIVHKVAVMAEESGEALRAALQYQFEDGTMEELKTELRQTGAMCLRVLMELEEIE